ncbi:MAG: hypothetical protein OEU91_06415 [Gammaproteobacteria bacterium]|nr:hypothetical protein [Gammaproteobacteria bacterium]
MRYVVYLMLVANLVYFAWNMFPGSTGGDLYSALPPVPDSAKPLVTLKEMQQQSAASSETGAIEMLTANKPPSAGMSVCQALGPFAIVDEVKAVTARLDKLGLQPRQRIAEVQKENGYWVYVPPMERAAALEIARKLDENGDGDYFIGRDNLVSLGAFKNIARAELRLRQVRKLELGAILEARFRTHDAYWLEFRKNPDAERELSAIMGKHPQLQLNELACF